MKLLKMLMTATLALILFASGPLSNTHAFYEDPVAKVIKLAPGGGVAFMAPTIKDLEGGSISVLNGDSITIENYGYLNGTWKEANQNDVVKFFAIPHKDWYIFLQNNEAYPVYLDVSKLRWQDEGSHDKDGDFDYSKEPIREQKTDAVIGIKGGNLTLSTIGKVTFPNFELDGNPKTIKTGVPSITVSDLTGRGYGWRVSVSASPFKEVTPVGGFKSGTTAKVFNTESFTIQPKSILALNGAQLSNVTLLNSRQSLNNGEVSLATAQKDAGIGQYQINFDIDAIQLQILNTKAYVDEVNYPGEGGSTPYSTVLTWAITVGP